MKNARKADRQQ